MQESRHRPAAPGQAQFESWRRSLPAHVAAAVRAHPPFVPHRLKTTGQTVFIARFAEGEPGEPRVTVSVIAPQAANPLQATDIALEGVDPDDLHSLGC